MGGGLIVVVYGYAEGLQHISSIGWYAEARFCLIGAGRRQNCKIRLGECLHCAIGVLETIKKPGRRRRRPGMCGIGV